MTPWCCGNCCLEIKLDENVGVCNRQLPKDNASRHTQSVVGVNGEAQSGSPRGETHKDIFYILLLQSSHKLHSEYTLTQEES